MNMALLSGSSILSPFSKFGFSKGIDWTLVVMVLCLLSIGIVFSFSSSIAVAEADVSDSYYYLKKHMVYVIVGAVASFVVIQIPTAFLLKYSPQLLFIALVLLVIVLIPGVGVSSHGARRWLGIGPLTFQVSELAKVAMILFLSGYVIRRQDEIRSRWRGFSKPLVILGLMLALLLLEPDFGSAVVMTATVFGMLFLAGIHFARFSACLAAGGVGFWYLATSTEYRKARLDTFFDPWANQYDSGYQLTQALIAFGRGEWFGLGLGNSLQKLFYLPEAHTDFVFAVIAEELGLFGVMVIIGLLWAVALRIMKIGRRAISVGMNYSGHVCFGLAIMLIVQSFINIGVASGLLPTKGLTLPFISYGGSSLLMWMVSAAIVVRISRELAVEYPEGIAR